MSKKRPCNRPQPQEETQVTTYMYDAQNRLAAMKAATEMVCCKSVYYDARGRRIDEIPGEEGKPAEGGSTDPDPPTPSGPA